MVCATTSMRDIAKRGDTYPLRFGYDTHGQTTRDDGATWDETRWEFDAASGLNTSKVYADGSRIAYAYAADGEKTRTTWARGAWKENAYNVRRLVGGTTYSDETPSVAYEYDAARKMFAESLTRSKARRELVTHRGYSFDDQSIYQYSTDYDILGRPTNAVDSISSARAWVYNRRAELVAATLGTNGFNYAYDTIGNRLTATANISTNTYSANSLNQYTSILRASVAPCEKNLAYDADGNLTSDGSFSYSYDAENRLASVLPLSPANGSFAIENRYDHRHRRTQKVVSRFADGEWSAYSTHTYVWDGNNIALERIVFADGTERVCEYFWGADKSGTEQGAGGVGGLLAVSVDGTFYLPCYDHNGNIVAYFSESGDLAAQFVYDPYGDVIEQYGAQASQFSFGFSTKIHDREIGLVSYQHRFYSPDFGRWQSRDPIEEDGGENLYVFCLNSPVSEVDSLGMKLLIIKHWKGINPPGGWGDRGRNRGQTHYNEPAVSYKEVPKENGKIGFEVTINPPVSRVDVYFHEEADLQVAGYDENEHVQWIIKYDDAIEAFKREVEQIEDCPQEARLRVQDALNRLNRKKVWIVSENDKLDAPGGPHGHTAD